MFIIEKILNSTRTSKTWWKAKVVQARFKLVVTKENKKKKDMKERRRHLLCNIYGAAIARRSNSNEQLKVEMLFANKT